ncbi:MAG: hypothetical protein QM610_15605 [Chitinophagaceae bacterium]
MCLPSGRLTICGLTSVFDNTCRRYETVPDAAGKVCRQSIGPLVALADKSSQNCGFGCRHIPRYISEELAKKMRKDLDTNTPDNQSKTVKMSTGDSYRRYVPKEQVAANKKGFNALNRKEYEPVVFYEKRGGYVAIQNGHGKDELKNNLITAYALAKRGDAVILQKNPQGQKSADALRNGQTWEFKIIEDAGKNISNAVQNHLERGIGQSPNIVIHINQNMNTKDLIFGLYEGLSNDDGYYRNITIVRKDGIVYDFTRKDILSGIFERSLKK